MYHSITFGEKNTYDDWHIIADSRPAVSPPEPVFIFDEIPGKSGTLDLTQSLTGLVSYQDRTGSFSFIVENGYGEWFNRYSEIMRYLHGKRMKMTLEDDPDFYYIGRFKVGEWETGQSWSNLTIDYQLDPFKYSHVIESKTVILSSIANTPITFRDIEQETVPEITSTVGCTATFNGRTTSIPSNTPTSAFAIWPDSNGEAYLVLRGTSSGTATVRYRRVKL